MVKQWVWKKGNGSSKKEMQKKWLPKKEDKTKKHIDMKNILDYCIPSLNFAKHHLYKKCKDTNKESTNNKSVRFSFTQTQNLETSKVTGPRWLHLFSFENHPSIVGRHLQNELCSPLPMDHKPQMEYFWDCRSDSKAVPNHAQKPKK